MRASKSAEEASKGGIQEGGIRGNRLINHSNESFEALIFKYFCETSNTVFRIFVPY